MIVLPLRQWQHDFGAYETQWQHGFGAYETQWQHGFGAYETGRATDVGPSRVETRADFTQFLTAVLADLRATGADEWENANLERFLDAFADARAADVPEQQQEDASWRLFAEIVQAAAGYE